MNKAILLGRLTADPTIRYSQGERSTCIASFSIAVDRRFKRDSDPTADFFNCSAFGKIGEFAEKYLKKGTKVVIEGRLQNDQYEKDGVKITATKVIAESIEFAESKSSSTAEQAENKAPSEFQPAADIADELPFA